MERASTVLVSSLGLRGAVLLAVVLAAAGVPCAAQSPSDPGQSGDASTEALARRIDELERATKDQIEALRRELDERSAELARERELRAELERRVAELAGAPSATMPPAAAPPPSADAPARTAAPAQAAATPSTRFQAGAEQRTESPDPLAELPRLGKDLVGNVYSGDVFKVRLGGSLRTNFQHNSTPVGDQVSKALLPDPEIPGGGDNAGRGSFRALAGFTRLLFAVQGPDTLGGRTLGYLEMDFARNLSGGENGAINPNPRLRHAYLRWAFDDIGREGSVLLLTVGQTGGYADLIPDTVDVNAMAGGLGVVLRRNPRATVVYGVPVGDSGRLVVLGGIERPFLGSDTVGGDLGNGDVGEIPIFSAGGGYETTRRLALGDEFGIGSLKFGARVAWGTFEERFKAGTLEPDFTLQTDFDERDFGARAVHGGFALDRLGFNAEGRARTLSFKMGGLWTTGEASFLDAGFDRRLVLGPDGSLETARSSGGFVNPIFYVTDTLSLRWAGGAQYALDPELVPITGTFTNGYFRTRNWQSEASVWWAPGPFTFAIAYNFTRTNFRKIDPSTLLSSDLVNENSKVEAIAWFSF
jgi:hypothetical protein